MEAGKFRKRPVVIEAVQFEEPLVRSYGLKIAAWCGGRFNSDAKPSDHTDIRYTISIPTLEGVKTASVGDWIVRGVHGEFYPVKDEIFRKTYEPVSD